METYMKFIKDIFEALRCYKAVKAEIENLTMIRSKVHIYTNRHRAAKKFAADNAIIGYSIITPDRTDAIHGAEGVIILLDRPSGDIAEIIAVKVGQGQLIRL